MIEDFPPNIVVESLTLLLRIRRSRDQNLARIKAIKTGFSWFSSLQANSGIVP
jgi:hypothetical protein